MTWWFVGATAATYVAKGFVDSNQQKQAAKGAANAQTGAANAGLEAQASQLSKMQELMKPYLDAGNNAVTSQGDLLGSNGPEAQQKAIDAIKNGPQFGAMVQQGENGILQNASATGGLRGGNVQGALGQFRPQVLSQLINSQFSQLGSLSALGQNSAMGVSALNQQGTNNIIKLDGDIGSAQAGQALANGQANQGLSNGIFKGLGSIMGGF